MSRARRVRRSCAIATIRSMRTFCAGFRAATGLPALVNTSFNAHEEPIVNQPAECLRALRDRRVDSVVTEQSCYAL